MSIYAKPKILCLQGFGQNREEFYRRLATLRNSKKNFEFVLLDPPHSLPHVTLDSKEKCDSKCWYYFNEKDRWQIDWNSKENEEQLIGLQESVALVQKKLEEETFHSILGFSQGGALLALLCEKFIIPIDMQVIFVGSLYPLAVTLEESKTPLLYKSIHVYGKADQVIPMQKSRELAQRFHRPVEIEHKGKHVIPRFQF